MYCNSCGKEISNGGKFCNFCGKPISGSVYASTQNTLKFCITNEEYQKLPSEEQSHYVAQGTTPPLYFCKDYFGSTSAEEQSNASAPAQQYPYFNQNSKNIFYYLQHFEYILNEQAATQCKIIASIISIMTILVVFFVSFYLFGVRIKIHY